MSKRMTAANTSTFGFPSRCVDWRSPELWKGKLRSVIARFERLRTTWNGTSSWAVLL